MLALMAELSARSARPPLVGRPLSGRAVGAATRIDEAGDECD